MDIDKLLIEAGGWGRNPDREVVQEKFAELLYEEFQKMTLMEFKQHFHNKVTYQKETQAFVVEFAFFK